MLHVELGDDALRPSVAARGDTAVILDGVLLDRSVVAAGVGGSAPSDEPDAAFVLRAYLDIGERVLPLLRGSFGLIIWDGRRDTALFVRDATDSHPLFVSREPDRVLVSSSYGALLDLGGVAPDVDRLALARWAILGSMLPRRTLYARIERLPPGHVLTATPDGVRTRRYWHPRAASPVGNLTPADAADRLQELLDQAVARDAAAGRLGVFLSGGVDSAAVAASAATVARARSLPAPLALSCIFPTPEGDEEAAQRAVAGGLDIPQLVVPLLDGVGGDGLLAAALRLSQVAWTPCVNPWEPVYVRLAERAAASGCEVILSGEGGNDWFEAEWAEAADLIRGFRLVTLWRLWSQERRHRRHRRAAARAIFWDHGTRLLLRDFARAALEQVSNSLAAERRYRRAAASIDSGWALPDRDLLEALADELLESRTTGRRLSYHVEAKERRLESVHMVVPMENRFLFGRRIGVRFLNPVVDPDLVSFAFGLPAALINAGDRAKGLARESVRRRAGETPAGLLGTASVGGFFGSLLRDEAPRALEALSGLQRLGELGIVDGRSFAATLKGPGLGTELSYYQAWQVLASEAWLTAQPAKAGGCVD